MNTELKIGDPAPDFTATAVGGIYGGGHEVKLADFAGSKLVLYFYPKDDTPGCTAQACEMRDSWRELQSKAELFGVSVDSPESHREFIQKYDLPFPLLSDPNREIVEAYQVWVDKTMYGKTYQGTERTTYVIGPDQKIKAILKKVKTPGHVSLLLQELAS
ncbi:MAG: peroxiredoxin [Verrucomicrobia bacterium]|nr:peroxiredoxin [Verrucomicrobiota bacterium]MBV9129840.1 peroxiredoxin [Verrucomicrobiota bacterium]MBV9298261.1 peroxiredoxin [Verrucomicrobiota bacterium]MBV9643810.1 peroxiredoxin [Verrucomicrobiota bacterium]